MRAGSRLGVAALCVILFTAVVLLDRLGSGDALGPLPPVPLPALGPGLAPAAPDSAAVSAFRWEGVLGTSGDLLVLADDKRTAALAESCALAEIERLRGIFSGWGDSELRRLEEAPLDAEVEVSWELFALLRDADELCERTAGAFDPYCGELVRAWRQAAEAGVAPDSATLAAALPRHPAYTLRRSMTSQFVTRREAGRFALDAVAKGRVLDLVVDRVRRQVSGVRALLLDIGGDIATWGDADFPVAVLDPRRTADNAPPLTRLSLRGLAAATSGAYARPLEIGGRRVSPLLDPRTGQPAEGVLSATVVAADATEADALATALCVLAPEEGIALVEGRSGAVCLLVLADGRILRSRGFAVLEREDLAPAPAGAWPEGWGVIVEFELRNSWEDGAANPTGEAFHRHYLGAWIEDEAGRRVRLLALWAEGAELAYVERLYAFWKFAWVLQGEGESTDDFWTIARATREPGAYRLLWDGLDDAGQPVPPGRYRVCLDINRELGPPDGAEGNTTASLELFCGGEVSEATVPDQPELAEVAARYGPIE